ncbi:MAG: T9SS sorting signal type C domain-containing protein [Bacteroidetes bacterium]|nr:T9SS sorting signal type C domain-containing protein [Bacteroidota bacterium]
MSKISTFPLRSFQYILFFLFLTLSTPGSAQVDLAQWPLSTDGNPVNLQSEVNAATLGFSSGLDNQQFVPGFGVAATGWSRNNSLTEYYEIAISPQSGENLNIEDLSFSHTELDAVWNLPFFGTRVVGGPSRFSVRYSKDPSFTTFTTLVNRGNTGINVAEVRSINTVVLDGETLYIRFYGHNSASFSFFGTILTGFWLIDENSLRITGTIERCGSTTTWTASGWNNGAPTQNSRVRINADYNTLTQGNFQACELEVNPGNTLTIAQGTSVTVENYISVNGTGNFDIESGGSLLQLNDNAVNTGNITIRRNTTPVTKFDFTYWSSPVSGRRLSDLSPGTLRDKYFSFNTNIQNWQTEFDGNTVMQPGVGYAVRSPQSFSTSVSGIFTANVQGVPNNGVIQVPVNAPNPGSVALIGNPYPSAIDADIFIQQNSAVLGGALYFWTHNTPIANNIYNANDYAVYTLFGGTGTSGSPIPTGQIASGQGFFVNLTSGGNINFNNSQRIAGSNNQFFRANRPKDKVVSLGSGTQVQTASTTNATAVETNKNRIWLNLTNDQGAFSQALMGYAAPATDGEDKLWDASYFDGFANVIGFYTLMDGNRFSVQAKGIPQNPTEDSFLLGYRTNISGEFSISLDKLDGLFEDMDAILLIDQLTGQNQNLKEGDYTFTTQKGVFNERFIIQFANQTLSLDDSVLLAENEVKIYTSGSQLQIESNIDLLDHISIFDLTGKRLFTQSNIDNNKLILPAQMQRGVLLVKIKLQNGKSVTKKVVF